MTDPLGDMLTRIRNGQQARKDSILTPASKLRAHVLDVLQREGYIRGYSEEELAGQKGLRIELKYFEGQPAIQHLARVSKPGRRVYSGARELPRIRNGLGIDHRVDAARRAVGRRSARPECRRRSAGGGVLMSRIGKKPVAMPAGVTADDRGPDPDRQGPEGHAVDADARRARYNMRSTRARSACTPANRRAAQRAPPGACSARWCRTSSPA